MFEAGINVEEAEDECLEPWPRPVVQGGVFEVHAVVLVEIDWNDFPMLEDGEPREAGPGLGGGGLD